MKKKVIIMTKSGIKIPEDDVKQQPVRRADIRNRKK